MPFCCPGKGYVTVENAYSSVMILCDLVFQGTVLGPPLWNGFLGDVATEVPQGRQIMNLFADDLTAETTPPTSVTQNVLLEELCEIQQRTHAWGERNQVSFDAGKEHLVIIHPRAALGDDFKMLGTVFDCRLRMQVCIEGVLAKARPKMRAILRLRHLVSIAQLIVQYKTHVWGFSEYSNGAVILASPSQTRRLDKMQRWFLRELGITDTEAFVTHNFAPPGLRRSIGMLGFLHKRVLHICHPAMYQALPMLQEGTPRWHSKSLHSFLDEVRGHHALYFRSLYGYIHIYNRLSQGIVDISSVSAFQAKLAHMIKHRAASGVPTWRQAFTGSADVLQHGHGH